jgi:uncharacterized protein (DUF885 family)
MTPVFRICEDYVTTSARLNPVGAGMRGITDTFGAATDYSPDGYDARADAMRSTLAALSAADATSDADRLAKLYLTERLEAELASHDSGESLRLLRAPIGPVASMRDSVELIPRSDEDGWRNVAARLAAIPGMLDGMRRSLDEGLARDMPAARRQAIHSAIQADRFAETGTHDPLVARYGDGPLHDELAAAARGAHASYAGFAAYLRDHYARRAATADAVGPERYAIATRLSLGADIDPHDAYQWGWAEIERIEAELSAEAGKVRSGASVDEATEILDETEYVTGTDAYRGWLQERHDQAISELNGRYFDIPEPLRRVEVVLALDSTSGAAYYTRPSEDLTRPGRTWWPVVRGRTRFATWSELSTVFHEGVPGHHLQAGAAAVSDSLSRFAKTQFVSGHGEGWALYAERLADELGWFTEPGTRLGMLSSQALRAARVVIDIGVHLDLPLPDGSRWTFETACDVLRSRGRAEPHRVHPEVVRYFGWPAQAISYKLGERAWLSARDEARARDDFDLKRWHSAALALGPVGLSALADELRAVGGQPQPLDQAGAGD